MRKMTAEARDDSSCQKRSSSEPGAANRFVDAGITKDLSRIKLLDNIRS